MWLMMVARLLVQVSITRRLLLRTLVTLICMSTRRVPRQLRSRFRRLVDLIIRPHFRCSAIPIGQFRRASGRFCSPSRGGVLRYSPLLVYIVELSRNYISDKCFSFMARRRSVRTINIPSSGSGAAVPLSLVSSSGYAWGDGSSDSFYLDSSGMTGPLDTVKVYSPENFSALVREQSVDVYDATGGDDSTIRARVRIRQRANSLTASATSYVFSAKKGVSTTLTFTTTASIYTKDQDPVNWLQYGTSDDSLYSVSEPVISGMTISLTVTTLSSWENTSVAGNFAEIWVQQGQLRVSTTVSQGAVTFASWGAVGYDSFSLTSSNDSTFAPLLNQPAGASSSLESRQLRYSSTVQYLYTCRYQNVYIEAVYTDGSVQKVYLGTTSNVPSISIDIQSTHPFSTYPMIFDGSGLGLVTESNAEGGIDYVLTCASPLITDEPVSNVPEGSLGAYFSLRAYYSSSSAFYSLDAGHITRVANLPSGQPSLYYYDLDAGGSSKPVPSSILLDTYDAVVRYQFILHMLLRYTSGYQTTSNTTISTDNYDVSVGGSLSASNHYKAVKDTAANGMVVTGGPTCLYPGTISYTRRVISSGGSSYVEYDNAITVTFSDTVVLTQKTYYFSVYRTGRGFNESGSLFFVVPTSEWESVYASYAKATLVLSYAGHTRTVESQSVLVPTGGGAQKTISIPANFDLLDAVSGDYTMTIEGGFDSWTSSADRWIPQFWESSVAVQVYYRLTADGTGTYFRPSDGYYPTNLVYGRYGSSTDYLYVTKNG